MDARIRQIRVPRNEIPGVTVPQVQRIPVSVIERIPPAVTREQQPPVTTELAPPVIDVPSGEIPEYNPMDYTEEDLEIVEQTPNPGTQKPDKPEQTDTGDTRDIPEPPAPPAPPPKQEQATIEIPIVDYELPVPRSEQVVLAGTTAFASVGATLLGKALVDQLVKLLKPVVKQLLLRIRALLSRDRTQYEEQQILAFEAEAKLVKRLKKEQKQERLKQRAEAAVPLHQRILHGKESQDEK